MPGEAQAGPVFLRGQRASSSVSAGVAWGAGFPGPHAWGCWRFRVHGCVLCICSLQMMLVAPSAPRGDIPASAASGSKRNKWQAVSGEVATFSALHSGPQRRQLSPPASQCGEEAGGQPPWALAALECLLCVPTPRLSVFFSSHRTAWESRDVHVPQDHPQWTGVQAVGEDPGQPLVLRGTVLRASAVPPSCLLLPPASAAQTALR